MKTLEVRSDAGIVTAIRRPICRESLAAGFGDGGRGLGRLDVSRPTAAVPEESLVVESRSAVTPAQMVESKLKALLLRSSLPACYFLTRGLVK